MDYPEKILLAVTVMLMALAAYLALTGGLTPSPSSEEAKALMMKGLEFGAQQTNYIYSFMDVSDGYKTTYTLTKNANERRVDLQNPLSSKSAYFLANDTVLCIRYPPTENEVCSSVQNDSDLTNYMNSLQSNFFNDSVIQRSKQDMAGLLEGGYLKIEPGINSKTVQGKDCKEVSYTIDYSNISVTEAARLGIGPDSPKIFHLTMCIGNDTGYRYERTLQYEYNGITHTASTTLLSFRPGVAGALTPPANLTPDVKSVLLREKEQQIKLALCHTEKQGVERDSCVSNIALNLHRKDICEIAGSWRDRCLVAIVPLTKDTTICLAVSSQNYKDDCYTELAGAYKNSTYCSMIQNTSKIDYCREVAAPVIPEPQEGQTPANETASTSDGSSTVNEFMDYLDKLDSNETNSTNDTAGG